MQIGEVLQERVMPAMVRQACATLGIQCHFFSDDWVAQLKRGDKMAWIFGYKFDINASAAASLAQDKVATHIALKAARIPSVPHLLARTYGMQMASFREVMDFLPGSTSVVIKPLNGTGGRGVRYYEDARQALAVIRDDPEPAWTMSPFLELVRETRLVMLDGEVLLAYEKHDPVVHDGLKFFNLCQGAKAADIEPSPALHDIARQTCAALSLRTVAVDIVRTASGKDLVLEVNDGIMTENYARQSPANAQRAQRVYEAIIARMVA
jgi:glutathione synthase/RimK-type ligase-like ATP-grasp enzyme